MLCRTACEIPAGFRLLAFGGWCSISRLDGGDELCRFVLAGNGRDRSDARNTRYGTAEPKATGEEPTADTRRGAAAAKLRPAATTRGVSAAVTLGSCRGPAISNETMRGNHADIERYCMRCP